MATIKLLLKYNADISKYPDHVTTQVHAARYDIKQYQDGEISLAELFDAVGEDRLTFDAGD
ncbi:hypothetical protein [Mycolicibacterium aubagnense]|uniref:Uncharacterized protein n=1 Tax=Mycolicibacterium aubagnense TaxID=319707 RepID=A0ABM7IM92_9MYCO|nr:hypothetical protein [Mycolicibacterium aubagnense]TLH64236.1 hypothetical protein C1S80_12535 [Mycolicibacterium aubagnense]BBX87873.1 hypothetical protein MAUB_57460 [Mycolicibacterium aubagnense]